VPHHINQIVSADVLLFHLLINFLFGLALRGRVEAVEAIQLVGGVLVSVEKRRFCHVVLINVIGGLPGELCGLDVDNRVVFCAMELLDGIELVV